MTRIGVFLGEYQGKREEQGIKGVLKGVSIVIMKVESQLGWDVSEVMKGMIDNEEVIRTVDWQSQLSLKNFSKMRTESVELEV